MTHKRRNRFEVAAGSSRHVVESAHLTQLFLHLHTFAHAHTHTHNLVLITLSKGMTRHPRFTNPPNDK